MGDECGYKLRTDEHSLAAFREFLKRKFGSLEKLNAEWFDYVDFHLTTLGCHFCRASFNDLQHQRSRDQRTIFQNKIMASTVGFLNKN